MQNSKYHSIIIGSGLGGLTCGATLAKEGKKILLLEQHNLIGGCATCFKRKGTLIDAGLHELDWGNEDTDMKSTIFKKLGLDKKITLVPLPTAWSIKESKDKQLTIPHKTTKEALITMFPNERNGIEQYFKKIKSQARLNYKFPFDMGFFELIMALRTLILLTISAIKNRKVGNMLDSMIKNPKLKKILNINLAYYHNNPYKFNWNFHAVAQANYYNQGMYIKGGSQSLSDALAEIIIENKGEIKINADVIKVLLNESKTKAIGVIYKDKKSGETFTLYADNIIANCDPRIVYGQLLNLSNNKDTKLTQNFTTNTSLLSIYMVFDSNLSEKYQDMDYSTFIVDSQWFNGEFNEKTAHLLNMPIEDRGFVFVNYSKIDHGLSQGNDRFFGVITALSSYDEWDNLSKEEYENKKQNIKTVLESKLEAYFPNIMSYCIHSELATPKTIERYTRTIKGTPYGYDQDSEGFFSRERFQSQSIKNLYFASSFGFPGGGFTGAILTGYRTARKILDPYFYLRRFSLYTFFGTAIGIVATEIVKFIMKG